MKKLILSAAIVLGSLSTFAQAAPPSPQAAQDSTAVVVKDEFTEIKLEEIPEAVTTALKTSFSAAVVDKAYVNEKKEYKLDVTVGERKGNLWVDENGKWIQK
ncbi:hypothetical protein [Flavobacterium cellulosilyticum]|uniref:Beta-lactamase-inhibitor-like PepSY-like domain-containing protein n=1 Tax=Flavobacterium cellulosilyticum TaxID=2541731 RepID=A0A4R5CP51_9FLAO|nr:hypothetical protein [Flavobacterium cellulosilyticum]TDD99342.1 hypothetical protein E0F76_01025 [Flavobacterium cellulosilyticum]